LKNVEYILYNSTNYIKFKNKIILLRDAHIDGNTIKESMDMITIKLSLRITSKVRLIELGSDMQETSRGLVMLISGLKC